MCFPLSEDEQTCRSPADTQRDQNEDVTRARDIACVCPALLPGPPWPRRGDFHLHPGGWPGMAPDLQASCPPRCASSQLPPGLTLRGGFSSGHGHFCCLPRAKAPRPPPSGSVYSGEESGRGASTSPSPSKSTKRPSSALCPEVAGWGRRTFPQAGCHPGCQAAPGSWGLSCLSLPRTDPD